MAELTQKTPLFDWEAGDFVVDSRGRVVTVTGQEAAAQIALKALNTVRSVYSIYFNLEDEDLDDKYGNETLNILQQPDLSIEARLSEIERATEEALIFDPWILGVKELVLKRRNGPGNYGVDADHLEPDEVEISLVLDTVFDDVELQGVILSNG